MLRLHDKLRKAESSVLVQIRTGRTGVAHFLYKAKVPAYETGKCRCGHGNETPRHLLLSCQEEEDRREDLGQKGNRTFARLLNTPEGAVAATSR